MAFTWGEVSKWAKKNGFKISKKNEIFVWTKVDNPDICGEEKSLPDAVTAIFNEITSYKWVEHQKSYKK